MWESSNWVHLPLSLSLPLSLPLCLFLPLPAKVCSSLRAFVLPLEYELISDVAFQKKTLIKLIKQLVPRNSYGNNNNNSNEGEEGEAAATKTTTKRNSARQKWKNG